MGFMDKVKTAVGGAKDKVDDLVEKNSDKIPDKFERVYNKASNAAEKVVPGEDGEPSPSEKLIKGDDDTAV